jgi:hypothetical protein
VFGLPFDRPLWSDLNTMAALQRIAVRRDGFRSRAARNKFVQSTDSMKQNTKTRLLIYLLQLTQGKFSSCRCCISTYHKVVACVQPGWIYAKPSELAIYAFRPANKLSVWMLYLKRFFRVAFSANIPCRKALFFSTSERSDDDADNHALSAQNLFHQPAACGYDR